MSRLRLFVGGIWKAGLLVAVGGTVLASSCSTSQVRAVLTGVEAVTSQLDRSQDNGISFSDWLSSELDD